MTATLKTSGAPEFQKDIKPILETYCFDCHADGADKGGVALDALNAGPGSLENRETWWKALKNVRAGLMPPGKKPQPNSEEKDRIVQWIKTSVFESDPAAPDPGRVTVRRLNRVEYHNTVRDLIGVDYDTVAEFPPDDTGYGFDNIGDVLTLSPMLLEKYFMAANAIVGEAVPVVRKVPKENVVPGKRFQAGESDQDGRNRRFGSLPLSFYTAAAVSNRFAVEHDGQYKLAVDLTVNEKYVDNVYDYNKCRFIFRVDGRDLLQREFSWEGGKPYHYDLELDWTRGEHLLEFELQPLTPGEEQTRTLSVNITSVTVRGPMAQEHWGRPKNHERFFPKEVPSEPKAQLAYAKELLGDFARRAFRRPADARTVDRLSALAENIYRQPGKTFEGGIAQAMVAVLASPRFLFREEAVAASAGANPNVDEYSLASRLSYFLWSSMPDDELFRLASQGKLRTNLSAQVTRMLADGRSEALVKNFTGQWLQARDIDSVQIEARQVLAREEKFDPEVERKRKRFFELNNRQDGQLSAEETEELQNLRAFMRSSRRAMPRADFSGDLRRAMRQETEKVFDYVIRQDRSVLELIDSDYTFLNERLAKHYGITNVVGEDMRLVTLPPDSPRGGILAQGTVLAVTSNPTRTSPVKRGVFILDNILGTPPAPPPPDIPPLEDATQALTNRSPSLREMLAVHRENALCSSCHNRMDPLGLALENFNALGMWREREYDQPIESAGQLITGEHFATFKELKRLLAQNHSTDFYRTLTEKMLVYALGRGLDYYDVETEDQIVARMIKANGRPSALLMGIVESAPFQRTRNQAAQGAVAQGSARR